MVCMKFKVALEQDEDGMYTVTVPSLPGCISQGKTEDEALKNIKEAIDLHLESMAEDGIPLQPSKTIKMVSVSV